MDIITHRFLFDRDALLGGYYSYRNNVKRAKQLARKLESPINTNTGKPLREATIGQYRSKLRTLKTKLMLQKQAIAILARCRLIGPRKDEDCPLEAIFLRVVIERLAETIKGEKNQRARIASLERSVVSNEDMIGHWKTLFKGMKESCDFWHQKYLEVTGKTPNEDAKEKETQELRGQLVVLNGGRPAIPRGPFSHPH